MELLNTSSTIFEEVLSSVLTKIVNDCLYGGAEEYRFALRGQAMPGKLFNLGGYYEEKNSNRGDHDGCRSDGGSGNRRFRTESGS
jgi:hypothetical protein